MRDDIRGWLGRRCDTLEGVRSACLLWPAPGEPDVLVCWPEDAPVEPRLQETAESAARHGRRVVRSLRVGDDERIALVGVPVDRAANRGAGPPASESEPALVVAVELDPGDEANAEDRIKRVCEALRAEGAWLYALRDAGARVAESNAADAVLEAARSGATLEESATGALARLVAMTPCSRAGFFVLDDASARVIAVSNGLDFDRGARWLQPWRAAVEESMDAGQPLAAYAREADDDASDEVAPVRPWAHRAWQRTSSACDVFSVPVESHGERCAFAFEAPAGAASDRSTRRLCELAARRVGPALLLARRAERGIWRRCLDDFDAFVEALFGPGHTRLKVGVYATIALIFFASLLPVSYRVRADARLEGRVQRAIVAGMDGFVAEAHVRAGEIVQAGQILARLDDRDLRLEQQTGDARLAELEGEFREALARHDRSQASILRARMRQAAAEQALVEARLARTSLVAPFDGVVVAGDLSQRLGSPVERGEMLFELAPRGGYRIILEVDERDVAAIAEGGLGHLKLQALPAQPLPLRIARIQPVTVAEGGRNHFRVEAELVADPVGSFASDDRLRPGMEGIARLDAGDRPLLWIATHRLIDWLRLGAWSWW